MKRKIASACKPFFIALLIFLLPATAVMAQKEASAFEKKLMKEFCEEFTKQAPNITKENIEMELGLLILPLMTKYEAEMKSEWNLDFSDPEDLQKIGFKIGQLGALECAAFRTFFVNNMKPNEAKPMQLTGKFLKLEGQPFSYLLVQNAAGKTEKIYWLEFFEGADQLTSPSALLNKAVTVSYKEIEVYDAAAKDYRKIKVATKLKL